MSGAYEKRLLRVIDHIYVNPDGDLSLDTLADVAALSRFHWHRVFRAMTGETAAEAVRRIRMHRAACWLLRENWPLAEVARRAGYPNAQSFARTFTRTYHVSPTRFRQSNIHLGPPQALIRRDQNMFEVTIRTEPARRLATLAHRGPYIEIGKTFEKLGAIITARGLWGQSQGIYGVYYYDPSVVAARDLRSCAGIALAKTALVPAGLTEVHLAEGRVAALRFKGHYSGLQSGYDYLFGPWLAASGEIPRDAPAVEVYLNTPENTAPQDLLTEICLPLA